MYREQNYIFSFTFVYKSKTACLVKTLVKKTKKRKEKEKKRKKNKYPQTTFSSIFLDSEDFFFPLFVLWFWFYFTSMALFYLQ